MASNPSTAEFVMAAQQGKLNQQNESGSPQPKLTKKKTLEVFEKQQELSLEHMQKLGTKSGEETTDQNEMMLQMMVDQAKMHDQMFFKTGVENEDFEESLMYFVLNKDPDVQKCMQEYMTKMQAEMNKAASN